MENFLCKLDIGCGINKKKGYMGVDVFPFKGVDFVCNLEKPLPIRDNCIYKIHSYHSLEHIENLTELIKELERICKNDAEIEIYIPYFRSSGAFQDPTHRKFFTWLTFDYFSGSKFVPHYDLVKFKILEKKLLFGRIDWDRASLKGKFFYLLFYKPIEFLISLIPDKRIPLLYENTFLSAVFPASEIKVVLKVVKQRR